MWRSIDFRYVQQLADIYIFSPREASIHFWWDSASLGTSHQQSEDLGDFCSQSSDFDTTRHKQSTFFNKFFHYLQHEMRDTIFNGLLKQSSQKTPVSNFSVP